MRKTQDLTFKHKPRRTQTFSKETLEMMSVGIMKQDITSELSKAEYQQITQSIKPLTNYCESKSLQFGKR